MPLQPAQIAFDIGILEDVVAGKRRQRFYAKELIHFVQPHERSIDTSSLKELSGLLQVVFQNDLKQDLMLLSSLNLPIGANGTEFGGLPTDTPDLYLSTGPSVFFQLRWYW